LSQSDRLSLSRCALSRDHLAPLQSNALVRCAQGPCLGTTCGALIIAYCSRGAIIETVETKSQ